MQEAYQKEIKHAFGVLQLWFAIICNPGRLWKKEDLWTIMMAAVLLHNMIIKDEQDTCFKNHHDYHVLGHKNNDEDPPPESTELDIFLLWYQAIQSQTTHAMLKEDLIDHLWKKHGEERSEGSDNSEDSEDSEDKGDEWGLAWFSHFCSLDLILTLFVTKNI